MIFYDNSRRRKVYVRAMFIVIVLLCLAVAKNVLERIESPKIFSSASPEGTYTVSSTTKKVALTFDDGPEPGNTLKVLRILKEHDTPATFFFTGQQMLEHRDIALAVHEAGYEIGNHSFTHSLDVHSSRERLRRELNSTNEILKDITGYSSRLYRPPFLLDIHKGVAFAGSTTTGPVAWATEDGFIVVGADIDTFDWEAESPKSVIEYSLTGMGSGHMILLHDGGGADRESTILALPYIIEAYKREGYEFVNVSELIGLSRVQTTEPSITTVREKIDVLAVAAIAKLIDVGPLLSLVLLMLTLYRIAFFFILLPFARPDKNLKRWNKGVTVLIPAYNEGANIEATVMSAIYSTHPDVEIIVLDDGSTDDTAEKVLYVQYRERHANLHLVRLVNGGKASALNEGIMRATHEVIVAVDGDTIIEPGAIEWLAAHFNDPTVGAVAGHVRAVSHPNLLSALQRIEYSVMQQVDKAVLNLIGIVGVVPGAIGAWRKSTLIEVGGYSTDTLVEDQDLTYAVHVLGKRVIYEPRAISHTEAPHTLGSFIKQRFRWVFGSIQCVWKYRGYFFSLSRPMLGWVMLPYSFIFLVVLPLTFPIVDAMIIIPFLYSDTIGTTTVLTTYALFVLLDTIYAAFGIRGERASWLLFLVPIQRIYYRFVITFVLFYSLVRALEGSPVFWQKQKRNGAAQALYERLEVRA